MKNTIRLSIVALCLAMTMLTCSCKNDSEENGALIVGKWKLTAASNMGVAIGSVWEFGDDGTCSFTMDGSVERGSYHLTNSDKVVEMTISGTSIIASIERLDESVMILNEDKTGLTVRREFERQQ